MPVKNRKCYFEFVDRKFVCFYERDHAFKTIWRLPCLCRLIKIKGYFFKPGRLVFIIVINISCSGIFYAIYARQKFFHDDLLPNSARALFEFLLGINSVTNALTLSIYSYINQIWTKHPKTHAVKFANCICTCAKQL